MATHILIDIPVLPEPLARLRALPGVTVTLCEPPAEVVRPLPAELLREVDVLACSLLPENDAELRRLKLVQLASAGYEQIIGKGLPARGVRACNALGVFDVPIGEWIAAMLVNLARDVRGMIRHQEHGIWDRDTRFQRELRGSTVGFWGYGGIGREGARLAKALGMSVHVLARDGVRPRLLNYWVPGTGDPEGTLPDRVFGPAEENLFLGSLDFLVLAMPLTTATRGIVGEAQLRALRPGAWLLNPARGPLVQEAALLRALREGWLAGAALDTHYHYPMPADHPLWRFPNVIMTPHISGSSGTQTYPTRLWDILLQNVQRHLDGQPLLNELRPADLA
jgi:phosphoglycerate dehydrogenase-like enzyme